MKNLIFSDMHLADERLEDQEKIFAFIVDTAVINKVKRVIFTGDGYHNRKNITVACIDAFRRFVIRLNDYGISFLAVSGNHDKPFDDAKISAIDFLGNIGTLNKVVTNRYYKIENMLLLPFSKERLLQKKLKICYEKFGNSIQYIFAHQGINDIEINEGYRSKSILKFRDFTVFKNLKKVFLGHYHNRIEKGRFLWVGSPMQFIQGELKKKYIYLFENKTGELKDIETKFPKFLTYRFPANNIGIEKAFVLVKKKKDCFVRIIFSGDSSEANSVPKQEMYDASNCRYLDIEFKLTEMKGVEGSFEIKDDIVKMFEKYSKQEKMNGKVAKLGKRLLEKTYEND